MFNVSCDDDVFVPYLPCLLVITVEGAQCAGAASDSSHAH